MNDRRLLRFKPSYFVYSILLIAIAYALFEYFYIPYGVLAVDEFVFARQIYGYTTHLPYLDFPPYKGVLGYYLLSLPMYFSHDLLAPLFYIKGEIAFINTMLIVFLSLYAARLFDKRAVLLALLLIISNQLFLIYAADLRVDMLAGWCSLFAALFVLNHRLRLGGVLLGFAFLISQKALWYVFAMNGAMALCWFLFPKPRYSFRSLRQFNLAFILPIIIYIILWSSVSTLHSVLYSLFYEAYIQAGIDWYSDIYLIGWMNALHHGAFLFFMWPLTFLSLSDKKMDQTILQQHLFTISFASITLILFINYKQAFHYNFLLTIPAFFLLYADFFSWVFDKKNHVPNHALAPNPSSFFIFVMAVYVYFLWLLIHIFSLPAIYFLLLTLPIVTCFSLYSSHKNALIYRCHFILLLMIVTFIGILYPLYISFIVSQKADGRYQQTMIKVTADLIKHEGDYVSGVPYLYQKDQPISGMKNLISPAIGYLSIPSEKLKTLLLPSLFITPTTQEKIIDELETTAVKVIIANYRIRALPLKIKEYINQHYQHFYGSLYIYAPQIKPSQLSFNLKFSARYRLETKAKRSVMIDGKRIHAGQAFYLTKGDHLTDANDSYRLLLIPDINPVELNPDYKKDRWKKNE